MFWILNLAHKRVFKTLFSVRLLVEFIRLLWFKFEVKYMFSAPSYDFLKNYHF